MQKNWKAEDRRRLLLCLVIFGLMAALFILPNQFSSEAGSGKKPGADNPRTRFEYYDIRDQKGEEIENILVKFRQDSGTDSVMRADLRDRFVETEASLRAKVPTLKVEYNGQLRNPEVIAPDVLRGGGVLQRATGQTRAEILRNFAKQYDGLIGLNDQQIDSLKVTADYKNPYGTLSFARLEQFINDIPVFRGEIRAGFSSEGDLFRVVNNLAPVYDYAGVSRDFGDPTTAVNRALGYLNYELRDKSLNTADSTDLKVVFGKGDWATTAEKIYFPVEPGVVRPSWRVLTWDLGDAYYVIVDAETGTMLYRENITSSQTQSATYNVYANTNSMVKTMANPAPLSPNPIDPSLGTQGVLMPRSNVTLIGNEGVYSFNNLGWINDNANGVNGHTDGNNVEAGVDHDQVNGVDAVVAGTNRVFNFNYTPGAGPNNGPGDDPMSNVNYRNGASTNLFYVTNRYHDETYLLGFTEQARNFQNSNFGRGGAENDRISAEAQDQTLGPSCSSLPCANNANFSTPADGGRGRMQMYIWNLMNPIRDGDLDAEIIIHELTHGLFGRLHNGVGGTQAGQMNEGNSDFFAHVMLALNNDPINGVYVTGGYSTLNLRTGAPFSSVGNYYYGIRRFPKAVIAFTGGPNNRPHNPLTYADIDPAQMSLTNGAFAPAFTGSATAVHDGGEIWSSMLWEVRARLVQRLGAETGNKRVLQLVMDGMKVSPSNPTMKQERDAIISAALNNGFSGDVGDVWAGFALRGLGFSAQNPTGNTVVEGFDLPNAQVAENGFAVSDAPGDNDGFPEPGENLTLTIPVINVTGATVNNVTVSVNGGPAVPYGAINNGQTVTQNVPYTVPADAVCGSMHQVQIVVTSSVGTQAPVTKEFRLGAPVGGAPVTFTNNTLMNIPNGQPTTTVGAASPYSSDITVSGLTGNKTITVELTQNSHTWAGDLDILLEGPGGQKFVIMSDAFESANRTPNIITTMKIRDGAAATMPASGVWSATADFRPTNHGTTDTWASPAPAGPYNHPAPGGSATFASVFGSNGTAMNGTWKLWVVDDTSTDVGTMAGWKLTFEANDFACSVTPPPANVKSRADFDGDGRTDVSVFRPSEGNWYLNQSTAGFGVIKWGVSSDVLTPGDFDGDGKADLAIFRANADSSQPDFYILNSNGFTVSGVSWGVSGDIPVIRDYDGDGKDDVAVYRPSDTTWYILKSGGGATFKQYGVAGDVPVPGDYLGDVKAEIAVFRPSTNTWWIFNGVNDTVVPFGATGDVLVPADYNGDDKDDLAIFRPSTGQWIYQPSGGGAAVFVNWGTAGDIPMPGDYDGDGKDDQAIYRNGQWWINRSTAGIAVLNFGLSTDKGIPRAYVP